MPPVYPHESYFGLVTSKNCKIIKLCCFKAPKLWSFSTAAGRANTSVKIKPAQAHCFIQTSQFQAQSGTAGSDDRKHLYQCQTESSNSRSGQNLLDWKFLKRAASVLFQARILGSFLCMSFEKDSPLLNCLNRDPRPLPLPEVTLYTYLFYCLALLSFICCLPLNVNVGWNLSLLCFPLCVQCLKWCWDPVDAK